MVGGSVVSKLRLRKSGARFGGWMYVAWDRVRRESAVKAGKNVGLRIKWEIS